MFSRDMTIAGFDDVLFDAMQKEVERQEAHIELIASENYASPRVLEAQGSQLTNKYAEATPVSATTAAVSSSISLKTWPLITPKSCSAPPTLMFSPTQARKPTARCSKRWLSQAIPF